jgi:hypothetical protein
MHASNVAIEYLFLRPNAFPDYFDPDVPRDLGLTESGTGSFKSRYGYCITGFADFALML